MIQVIYLETIQRRRVDMAQFKDIGGNLHYIEDGSVYKKYWWDISHTSMNEFMVLYLTDGSSLLVQIPIINDITYCRNECVYIHSPYIPPSLLGMKTPDYNKAGDTIIAVMKVIANDNTVQAEWKLTGYAYEMIDLIDYNIRNIAVYRQIAKSTKLWDIADLCKKYIIEHIEAVVSQVSWRYGSATLEPIILDFPDGYEISLVEKWHKNINTERTIYG